MSPTATTVRFRARSAALPDAELVVHWVRVIDALDEPFEATLEVHIADESVDPAQMLGKDFSIEMERATQVRRWSGVVRQVRHGGEFAVTAGAPMHGLWVEIVFVPALWFLSLRRDTRVFQDQTALEIARAVLEDGLAKFSRELEVAATGSYARREYCVQYQETDLAFVQRLLEEEGIASSFGFEGERELLRLTDANSQFPRIANIPADGRAHYRIGDQVLTAWDPVHRFTRRRGTTTTSVAVRDHDFTGPAAREAEARGEDEQGRDRESYEHGLGRSLTIGDYGGQRYGAHDAAHQAAVRQQMHLATASVVDGEGRSTAFAAGQTFELQDHPMAGFDGEYLVTRVEHLGLRAAQESVRESGGAPELAHGEYVNRFRCIPLAVPHRPWRRARKPSIAGHETATVTGPAGEEIHTDVHGRIKVQFHWDREGANDDHSSCFLRVRQAWAGASWGAVFLPRIGMEVIVSFVDGDPDRPLVTGCVYNAAHAPPYPLPAEKTKSTIKSQSSIGKPSGFHELRFEDKAGDEEIFTHAEKDQNEVVLANHTTTVGGDQQNLVGETQTQKVHQNQTERITGDQTMDVGTDRTVHVKGSFREKIQAGEKRNVDTGVNETITGFEYRKVTGGLTEKVTGGAVRLVIAGIQEDITGLHKQAVTGTNTEVMLSGSTQTVSTGPITYDTAGVYKLKSGGPIALNGMAGLRFSTLRVEQTTKLESEFKPIYFKPKANDVSVAGTTVDIWPGSKVDLFKMSLGTALAKVSLFGVSVGFYALKWAVQGVKIDLYGKKVSVKFAEVSMLTFKFDL